MTYRLGGRPQHEILKVYLKSGDIVVPKKSINEFFPACCLHEHIVSPNSDLELLFVPHIIYCMIGGDLMPIVTNMYVNLCRCLHKVHMHGPF